MKFLLRRLGFYLLAAWTALTINFILPRLMPGDPAAALFARFHGKLHPEAMEALRLAFGLTHEPLPLQYLSYLRHVLRGDLGISIAYFPAPVSQVIATGLLWSAFIAGSAAILSFVIGTVLGAMAAWWRGGLFDKIAPQLFSFFGAFPYFWLAMALLYWLGFQRGLFPLGHAYDDDLTPGFNLLFVADVLRHALLPIGSIVLANIGAWLLGMRNAMIAQLGSEPVALARAAGLSPLRVAVRTAARNALLPNVTAFGMALGYVLAGSLLTEIVFSYPGQGYLLVQAVRSQDYPLMQGIFLVITLAVLGANWFVDLALLWLDPRTREASR